MEDFAILVDQNHACVEVRQEHLLVEIGELDRMLLFQFDIAVRCSGGKMVERNSGGFLAVENTPDSRDRLEQIALVDGGIRLP